MKFHYQFSLGLIFVSENIVYYNFSNGNKQITKTNVTGWNDGVFMSTSVVCSPVFSVRIILRVSPSSIYVGGAFNTSHFTQQLTSVGWCISSYFRRHFALGSIYFSQPPNLQVGQIVTVKVDLALKQILYLVNGNSTGPAINLSLTDSQMLLLRPIVQLYSVGDSVEIIS